MKNLHKLLILLLFAGGMLQGQSHAQQASGNWALKVGALGAFNQNFSLELDRKLSPRMWLTLRGGITSPNIEKETPFADGFFVKAGPRFYLSASEQEHSGPFVQAVLLFNQWRNRQRENSGRFFDIKETSLGAMVEAGYSIPIKGSLRVEPFFGFGFVPTWDSYSSISDQPPYEESHVSWSLSYFDYMEQPHVSHLPLKTTAHLAISGGLNIGITF